MFIGEEIMLGKHEAMGRMFEFTSGVEALGGSSI